MDRLAVEGAYMRGLLIVGPKGCGKTASLLKLKSLFEVDNKKCLYIDITDSNAEKLYKCTQSIKMRCEFLFLDNAQNFNKAGSAINIDFPRVIIAAFSPGTFPGGNGTFTTKSLGKSIGDGKHESFFFRPFEKSEAKEFLSEVNSISVVDNEADGSGLELGSTDFNNYFFLSGGAPRYISHFISKREKNIIEEVKKQHQQYEKSNANDLVLSLVSFNTFAAGDRLTDMGLAYKNSQDHFCLAHPLHLKLALRSLDDFSAWHKLETYTLAILQLCPQVASNGSSTITLPKAQSCLVQKTAGGVPSNMVDVSILKLVDNHPVIDSILFDGVTKIMYFLQTSKSTYGAHNTQKKNLTDKFRQTTNISIPDHLKDTQIGKHYRSQYNPKVTFYVYCTCSPTAPRDKDVYVLDLNVLQTKID